MQTKPARMSWCRVGVLVLATGLFALPALGAVDMFIKIEGIDGESKDKGHEDWIEVLSISQSVFRPKSEGTVGGGGGRNLAADRSDFQVGKTIDKASPKLAEACCKGSLIPEVRIDLVKQGSANRVPYMQYRLHNVQVSSYSVAGSSSSALPVEQVSLNYEAIEWKYTELDPAGRPRAEHVSIWDFVRNLVLKQN